MQWPVQISLTSSSSRRRRARARTSSAGQGPHLLRRGAQGGRAAFPHQVEAPQHRPDGLAGEAGAEVGQDVIHAGVAAGVEHHQPFGRLRRQGLLMADGVGDQMEALRQLPGAVVQIKAAGVAAEQAGVEPHVLPVQYVVLPHGGAGGKRR